MGHFHMQSFFLLFVCFLGVSIGSCTVSPPHALRGVVFWEQPLRSYDDHAAVSNQYTRFLMALKEHHYSYRELSEGDRPQVENVTITSHITRTQPFTGLVLWNTNPNNTNPNLHLQLEYLYIRFDNISLSEGVWDWGGFEHNLTQIANRGHQAIVRPYAVWPGLETTHALWLKRHPNYNEHRETVEGQLTWTEDWSLTSPVRDFYRHFFIQFAKHYDKDPRIAFLQVGFGSYAEYHLYGGERRIAPFSSTPNFPDYEYQYNLHLQLDTMLNELHWAFSIDARWFENAGQLWDNTTAFPLMNSLTHGLFDDSLFLRGHSGYNMDRWREFQWETRNLQFPSGGEIGFRQEDRSMDPHPSDRPRWIQEWRALLTADHPLFLGETWEQKMARLKLQYVIGSWMPMYHSSQRINEASMSMGYKFRVLHLQIRQGVTSITLENFGYSPLFYDAYITVNGVRATMSLRALQPGQSQDYTVHTPLLSRPLRLTIECDRLVPGQVIEFEANLQALVEFPGG